MKPPMLHTVYKITTTRDAYGSYSASGSTALPCHIRLITAVATGTNNEMIQSDAMAWFEPDSGIEKKDIIKFGDEHYRIERVTEARRLRQTSVLFLKCDLVKYGVIS